VAFTADSNLQSRLGVERVRDRIEQSLRSAWINRHQPEEIRRRRWTAATALLIVAVVGGLLVPRASATTPPTFDVASALPSIDPPAALPATAVGPAAPELQPVNVPLPLKPTVPVGKGMWVHQLKRAQGGDPHAIVDHALRHGLTHVYIRLGSSRMGFYAQGDLDRLLPVAHAAGIKVIGWDFPYLHDPYADAQRSAAEVAYTTPSGHRIDGFSADIETRSEGTNLTTDGARAYGIKLRELVGNQTLLIAAVPRPNPKRWYPYEAVTEHFDAIAPMVYWVNRDPATDVHGAITALAPLGKPVVPVGQAYDPAIDGSASWAPPSAADLHKFMQTAADLGVASYSFWAWDTASGEQWQAIAESKVVDVRPLSDADGISALQRVLNGLGHPVAVDGTFGDQTRSALAQLQRQLGVPPTGVLDKATLLALKNPR
jgi:hypothetical protein